MKVVVWSQPSSSVIPPIRSHELSGLENPTWSKLPCTASSIITEIIPQLTFTPNRHLWAWLRFWCTTTNPSSPTPGHSFLSGGSERKEKPRRNTWLPSREVQGCVWEWSEFFSFFALPYLSILCWFMILSLAKAELYIAIATIFRRYHMELYDTIRERDINIAYDGFLPQPSRGNKGVRVIFKNKVWSRVVACRLMVFIAQSGGLFWDGFKWRLDILMTDR